MDIRAPRTRRMESSGRVSKSSPEKRTAPRTRACGGNKRRIAKAVADFPDPDSPTSPKAPEAGMLKLTSRTAATSPVCVGNVTFRFSICSNEVMGTQHVHSNLKAYENLTADCPHCFIRTSDSVILSGAPLRFLRYQTPGRGVEGSGRRWQYECSYREFSPHCMVRTPSTSMLLLAFSGFLRQHLRTVFSPTLPSVRFNH